MDIGAIAKTIAPPPPLPQEPGTQQMEEPGTEHLEEPGAQEMPFLTVPPPTIQNCFNHICFTNNVLISI